MIRNFLHLYTRSSRCSLLPRHEWFSQTICCAHQQQSRCFAAEPPAPIKKGPAGGLVLHEDQAEGFVESDARKLCTHVCVNYREEVESPGPELLPDSEYPDWLFKLDLEPYKDIEDLDPERDGWKYWQKWEQRRQDQEHLHNKLKYKFFWMQDSPSVDMVMRHTKYKEKGGKFHIIPNTTPVYQKSTRRRRLQSRNWSSLEEPDHLLERNE